MPWAGARSSSAMAQLMIFAREALNRLSWSSDKGGTAGFQAAIMKLAGCPRD
jgi:hypothetical protein